MGELNGVLSVGQLLTGTIRSFAPYGTFVEVSPGVVGIIWDAVQEQGMEVGDAIRVQVIGIGPSGEVYLASVAESDIVESDSAVHIPEASVGSASDEGRSETMAEFADVLSPVLNSDVVAGRSVSVVGDDTIRPWMNWRDMPYGHKQATTALMALRQHASAFRQELANARKEYERNKTQSQKVYESEVMSANRECESEKKECQEECDRNVNLTGTRRTAANNIVQGCEIFQTNIPENASEVRGAVSYSLTSVRQANDKVQKAIGAKINAYKVLCECSIAEAERVRNEKIDKARREQIERDEQTERSFESKNRSICEDRRADIASGFNKATIKAYAQGVMSTRFNGARYECRELIPDQIMLGTIGCSIPNQSKDDMTVVQAIETQADEFGRREAGSYTVSIPYSQNLDDGISLMIRYSPNERTTVQNMMQPLLLKLFMSFPAGKLEATMIDPLEMGASFPDIPRLAKGPNASRIIDTKIWSKERDIENAIATFRQKLENMTQAYGTDKESRLKKEAVRVLAITDFPTGFNDTALKDLHAIVRNSASLGVCVLICANDVELGKLMQRNETLVTEISQSVVETRATGGKLLLVGEKNEGLFLQLDDMSDVLENKDDILYLLSDEIDRRRGKIEKFADMYKSDIYDSNNWFTGNHDEIDIPLGIKGANDVVKMVLGRGGGSTEHHALIAGKTGAGKSTLLHTLIMSTMISYSPDEVELYLLDFKEGVEFNIYTQYRLPSLRVVALNSEREFGLNVLKELCNELETRTKYFSRYGKSDINGYSELSDVPKIPKLILIFDEVQELFRKGDESDSISADCLSCINRLVMQGRAMGIHLILACQDFRNCSGLEAYFSQMSIRIAIKGAEEGISSILSSDNTAAEVLRRDDDAGSAIYNNGGGVESANNFFQVSYLEEQERKKLLECLDEYYRDPAVAELYKNLNTRIMLTNAEDNYYNCFNQLINVGPDTIQPLTSSTDSYGLLLGQGFGKKTQFISELRPKESDNLLIVTRDEKMALSLFEFSAMSVLYEELHSENDKKNKLVYIVDLFADEISDDECNFRYLRDSFKNQIEITGVGDIEGMINTVYDEVMARSEGRKSTADRLFLMFFGINRARKLRTHRIYDDDSDGLSTLEKLHRILTYGPKLGVSSIVWGEGIRSIENILGDSYDGMFGKRIAYDLDDDSMDNLVSEAPSKNLKGKSAVYMDINNDVRNTHFRPYDIPAKEWIDRYSVAYEKAISE